MFDTIYFSDRHAEARRRFTAAAAASATAQRVWSAPFTATGPRSAPLLGRDAEELGVDFAWFGAIDAPAVLILSSGTHGAEALPGSAGQLAVIDRIIPEIASNELGVFMIHGVNPWGASHERRADHEGVDVMRNFLDFTAPPPTPSPILDRFVWALAPQAVRGPQRWFADAAVALTVLRYGLAPLKAEIPCGQYAYPLAPFYGGVEPSWSRRMLEATLLREVGRSRRAVAMIDIHTGLGARGVGKLLGEHETIDAPACQRARDWFGATYEPELPETAAPRRFEKKKKHPTAYRLNGGMPRALRDQVFGDPMMVSTVLEFGTAPALEVLNAVRSDHAVWRKVRESGAAAPDERAPDRRAAREAMRNAFNPDDRNWRIAVIEQTIETAQRAAAGLIAS